MQSQAEANKYSLSHSLGELRSAPSLLFIFTLSLNIDVLLLDLFLCYTLWIASRLCLVHRTVGLLNGFLFLIII
jgi:hypothetical protein